MTGERDFADRQALDLRGILGGQQGSSGKSRHRTLLGVRKLVFRHHTLNLVRLDAVSKTSVGLDRHTLNDGVNLWHLDLHPPLRPLTAVKDFIL
jgi:hypothetical protein